MRLFKSVDLTVSPPCRCTSPLGQTVKILVSGQNFPPRGKIPVGFARGRGGDACIPLSPRQKSTIVLPQAKCRETRHCFRSPPANSLKGSGNFLLRKFPVSPVSLVSLHKGIISGRIISSPTSHWFKFFRVQGTFFQESPRVLRIPRCRFTFPIPAGGSSHGA